MRYCTRCGSEFQDTVEVCTDCPGSALVSAEQMRERGLPLPGEVDHRRFVQAGVAEDYLTAEELVEALDAARIPVLTRVNSSSAVDKLTSGTSGAWWQILVPEEHLAQAAALLERERRRLLSTEAEAIRAAEEEEAQTEASAKPA